MKRIATIRRKHLSDDGFTIVELLIVIVVIAILAAITIVAYNGIQNSAYDSSVQADISNFAKKVELEAAKTPAGTYPFPLTQDMGIRASQAAYLVRNNLYYCENGTSFAIGAISKSGRGFSYDTTNGARSFADGSASISGGQVCSMAGRGVWSTAYGDYALDGPSATWKSWATN